MSQVFIAIDVERAGDAGLQQTLIQEILDNIHHVEPMQEGGRTYVPGENTRARRKENLAFGIAVEREIWDKVSAL